jgi:hypothetical protein
MADESEQRAEQDVTAASEGYGGPVSDEELADVYLPEGQDTVQDTDSRSDDKTGSSEPDAAPDGSGTIDGASGEPAIEPPD